MIRHQTTPKSTEWVEVLQNLHTTVFITSTLFLLHVPQINAQQGGDNFCAEKDILKLHNMSVSTSWAPYENPGPSTGKNPSPTTLLNTHRELEVAAFQESDLIASVLQSIIPTATLNFQEQRATSVMQDPLMVLSAAWAKKLRSQWRKSKKQGTAPRCSWMGRRKSGRDMPGLPR